MYHLTTLAVNMFMQTYTIKKASLNFQRGFFTSLILLLSACSSNTTTLQQKNEEPITISGKAQGTTYSVLYYDEQQRDFKLHIDSILLDFDNSLSSWNKNSIVSNLNNSDSISTFFIDTFGYFSEVYSLSQQIFNSTEGAFDPTVMPLILSWGFGFSKAEDMNEQRIDSLLKFISFKSDNIDLIQISQNQYRLNRKSKGVKVDFNAIAQGYSVDVIADFLVLNGIENYLVEIGGETKIGGAKSDGTSWKLGVDKPLENSEERELQAILKLKNKAVATSGSYRKFYEKDGKKYSHTIDPKTGYPVQHNLLSATVVAEDCATADAMATAFMVMGVNKALEFLTIHPELKIEAYFIYSDDKGKYKTFFTKGLQGAIEEL